MTKFNIYNPSPARRIIHNGLAEARSIEIGPRKSVENIELADHVVERLRDLANRNPDGELVLKEVVPAAPVPAMKMQVKDDLVSVVKARR